MMKIFNCSARAMLLALCALFGVFNNVHAGDGAAPTNAGQSGQYVAQDGSVVGFKSTGPVAAELNVYGECSVVVNGTGQQLFVALNSQAEWSGPEGFTQKGVEYDPELNVLPCTDFIYGDWGPWTPWAGSGTETRSRNRTCEHKDDPTITDDTCGACGGECTQTARRGPWGPFGACSASCGEGTQTRERLCEVATNSTFTTMSGSQCDTYCGGCTDTQACTGLSACVGCEVAALDADGNPVTVNVADGDSITLYSDPAPDFGTTCTPYTSGCEDGELVPHLSSSLYTSCTPALPRDCTLGSTTIRHGESITAYSVGQVIEPDSCTNYMQTRTCFDGTLSGSESYRYDTCVVTPPGGSCSFNGVELTEGESVTAFENSSVPYGSTCVSESRTCLAGNLTGSYAHSSCTVQPPANCTFDGQVVLHGNSVTAYQSSNGTCVSEQRTCDNGTLSGSYQYSTCGGGGDPVSCMFNGVEVAHGDSVTAWEAPAASSSADCNSEQRTCNDGTLSGSFEYTACLNGCTLDGEFIPHGESITAYSTQSIDYEETCASETRSCNDGVLSGSSSYQYSSCSGPSCSITKSGNVNWTATNTRGTTRGCEAHCAGQGLYSVRTDKARLCESGETGNYPDKSTSLYWTGNSLRCYSAGQLMDNDRSDKTQYCYCAPHPSCEGTEYVPPSTGGGSSGGGGGQFADPDEPGMFLNEK